MTNSTVPTGETITFVIDRMTLDIFEYWLSREWSNLTKGLYLATNSGRKTYDRYYHQQLLMWSDDESNKISHVTSLMLAQDRVDRVVMWISNDGTLSDTLIAWAIRRFDARKVPVGNESIQINIPREDALTPTEIKVANWLADGFSYPQIAKQMGRSEHAALKHGQNISRKWRTAQTAEVLAVEAQRRGFGNKK